LIYLKSAIEKDLIIAIKSSVEKVERVEKVEIFPNSKE